MRYDPDIHHRRSLRLRHYDYASAGAYFVTVCTHRRECLFGDVADDEMRMNDAGRMVESVWNHLPINYPGVTVDAYVVMPNHFHGIVVLVNEPVEAGPRACPGFWVPGACPEEEGHPQGVLLRLWKPGAHRVAPLRCRCSMWCIDLNH